MTLKAALSCCFTWILQDCPRVKKSWREGHFFGKFCSFCFENNFSVRLFIWLMTPKLSSRMKRASTSRASFHFCFDGQLWEVMKNDPEHLVLKQTGLELGRLFKNLLTCSYRRSIYLLTSNTLNLMACRCCLEQWTAYGAKNWEGGLEGGLLNRKRPTSPSWYQGNK